jgi:hypothetical protein
MTTEGKSLKLLRRMFTLNRVMLAVVVLIVIILAALSVIFFSQTLAERNLLDASGEKQQYEIAKLAAEIKQIRSDTSGSLFWLKVLGLLVPLGGAVVGYFVAQYLNTKKNLEFEHNRNVDAAYQSIVQGLSESSSILRATAAVKLGAILKSFPTEWKVVEKRQKQMIRLTKEVLAAALALETDPKVLKTLTIALVLHKHPKTVMKKGVEEVIEYADASKLDLSEVWAEEAYWAKTDFTSTDFYKANLARASFKDSTLDEAQFYFADLSGAKLIDAHGDNTALKFCDLRKADLTRVTLFKPNFEGSRVHGVKLTGAKITEPEIAEVDISKDDTKKRMTSVFKWLREDAEGKGLLK